MSSYQIDADALERVARFVAGMSKLVAETGVSFDPSYGGVSVGDMLVGDLRSNGEGFTLDVSNR